ncbi:unnamed protein product [Protopolystoma xenopodis]|uniref:Uncharacterized protein n=1 Tax=Protopolystoma xenopodis TaxID=117903 RepID=A0A448XBN2_9PLAT|nr:unnamed protein product [Protopolystoma xenopodis]
MSVEGQDGRGHSGRDINEEASGDALQTGCRSLSSAKHQLTNLVSQLTSHRNRPTSRRPDFAYRAPVTPSVAQHMSTRKHIHAQKTIQVGYWSSMSESPSACHATHFSRSPLAISSTQQTIGPLATVIIIIIQPNEQKVLTTSGSIEFSTMEKPESWKYSEQLINGCERACEGSSCRRRNNNLLVQTYANHFRKRLETMFELVSPKTEAGLLRSAMKIICNKILDFFIVYLF